MEVFFFLFFFFFFSSLFLLFLFIHVHLLITFFSTELAKTLPITSKMSTYSMSLQLLHGTHRKRNLENDNYNNNENNDDNEEDEEEKIMKEEGGGAGGAELGVVVKEGWLQKEGRGDDKVELEEEVFCCEIWVFGLF